MLKECFRMIFEFFTQILVGFGLNISLKLSLKHYLTN